MDAARLNPHDFSRSPCRCFSENLCNPSTAAQVLGKFPPYLNNPYQCGKALKQRWCFSTFNVKAQFRGTVAKPIARRERVQPKQTGLEPSAAEHGFHKRTSHGSPTLFHFSDLIACDEVLSSERRWILSQHRSATLPKFLGVYPIPPLERPSVKNRRPNFLTPMPPQQIARSGGP